MSDPRITPDPDLATTRLPMQIAAPHVDLLRRPDGPRDRQLLFGDAVVQLSAENGWSYVQADKDGYCGHVATSALTPAQTPTHKISARASHIYAEPDIKSGDQLSLSFGSRITALGETSDFVQTALGFVPKTHLAEIDALDTDPASVAALFLETPYLWGGNTHTGIDCSGLIQAACLACGIPCPGDSDLQRDALGRDLPAHSAYQRNDLLFWRGHVALICDENSLIHANAGHMATRFEAISDAIARIKAQGDGDPIAHKRLS